MTSSWWCLSPIDLSAMRVRAGCPMPLRNCLMRSLPLESGSALGVLLGPRVGCQTNVRGIGSGLHPHLGPRPVAEARRLDPALARDLVDGRQLLQPGDRR